MASSIGDDYDSIGTLNLGPASSNLQNNPLLQTSHFHGSVGSSPDLRQSASPNASVLRSNVGRNSAGLAQDGAALPSRLPRDAASNFGLSPEYLTGTFDSNTNEQARNTTGSFTKWLEQTENISNAVSGDDPHTLASNRECPDPTSSICLAALGLTCFCAACNSRRPNLASINPSSFQIGSNNRTDLNAGNPFFGLTAERTPQFTAETSQVGGNIDYSLGDLSTRLLENIVEQPNAQFQSASGPSIYDNFFYPSMSSDSTRSWNPNSMRSIGPANLGEAGRDSIGSMGQFSPERYSQNQSRNKMPRPHRDAPRKRGYRRNLNSDVSHAGKYQSIPVPMTPACQEFLQVQEYLDVGLKTTSNLTDSWKKNLAKLVNISIVQLELYIEARKVIRPKIEDLASVSENLRIPAEHVAAWLLQVQPPQFSRDVMNDSAYHSSLNSSQERKRPAKRQKTNGDEDPLRLFQCTFIGPGKAYCLQLSKDYGDWKRHEETHYPQKRWVCLIEGSEGSVSCHECLRKFDLAGQPMTINHAACLTRPARQGHFFPRKDKLLEHIRSQHKCTASTDTWYQNVSGNWNRQCGFCGEIFSDWEKRCRHVGLHFQNGKRMIPDWKDPWPSATENSNQRPDDDNDNNDDKDIDDDNLNRGGGAENGSPASKDNSRGNGRGSDQRRGNRKEPGAYSSSDGERRGSSNCNDQPGDLDQQCRKLHSRTASQSESLHEKSQYSERLLVSQNINIPFRYVRKLGNGAFGTVDEIIHSPSNVRLARKRIRTVHGDRSEALAQVRKEITCLRQLNHQHIIKVMASHAVQHQISIIISPIADCNLWEFMRSPALQTTTQRSHLSKWFGCLASALSYVHRKSWLHMDLKPQNILISGDRVLLSDFGSAYSVANPDMGAMAGMGYAITPMYCAPELAGRGVSEAVSWASDIYSLGCIYLEMATSILRQSVSHFEDLRSSGSGDKSFNRNAAKCTYWIDRLWEICKNMSPRVRDKDFQVIRSMLSFDTMRRPTAHHLEEFYSTDYYCDEESHSTADYYVIKPDDALFFDIMVVASTWLRTCDNYHKHCSHQVVDFFPTRILNVGAEGDMIRLQTSFCETSGPYIALTHCWGAGNIPKTTSQTLDERFSGIQSSSLSGTFQNAVRITRALGFNYLWIDSLCIVQDSPEDWAKVSSQMHKIYSNSYLTISILNEEESPTIFSRNPATKRLAGNTYCTHRSRAFQALLEDTASTMILDNPISTRAWTFQERLLSPRVLHFSSTRLAWECGSGTSIFDSVSSMRNSMGIGKIIRSSHILESNDVCLAALQRLSTIQVRKLWQDIVREYSKRNHTRPSDKLPALAGLAATISSLGAGEYLAGLWNGDLKRGLLWSRDLSSPPTARPAYRAPSWSWAAIDSQVVWSKSVIDLIDDCRTTILSVGTTLYSKFSPFGAVSDGYLEISGPLQKAIVIHPYVEQLLGMASLKPIAFVQWDALTVPAETRYVQYGNGHQIEELCCLQILYGAGLVLKERWDCAGKFQRVGLYWTRVDDANEKFGEGGWKQQTITIL